MNANPDVERKDREREKNKRYYAANRQREKDRCKAYHNSNRDAILANDRKYYVANRSIVREKARLSRLVDPVKTKTRDKQKREERIEYYRAYSERNKARIAAYSSVWARANRDKKRACVAKRRSLKLKAIPLWIDVAAVDSLYAEAARLSETTGVVHEVDHIVPLQNPLVCGLHWEGNLQILSRTENRRKLNKLLVEMITI